MSRQRSSFFALATALLSLGVGLLSGGLAHASPQYSYDCTRCHTMPPKDSAVETPLKPNKKDPFTGAVPGRHTTHADSSASSCAKCHGDGVTGYGNAHRNKKIELRDSLTYGRKPVDPGFMNQTSVPPAPLATCTTALCHSNGKGVNRATPVYRETPSWSSTAGPDCNMCHDAAPSTNKHGKHITDYGYGCVKCHSDHAGKAGAARFQHATSAGSRNIDVHFTALPNTGGSFAAESCSNMYCHSDGKGTTKSVSWTGSLPADCSGCHGNATSSGADALSGAHPKHVNNASVLGTDYGCVKCHADTVSNNTTISSTAKHVDGAKDVTGACSSCHQDGKGTPKTAGLDWATTTLDCTGCHGAGSTTAAGEPTYANTGKDTPFANSHAKHVSGVADCIKCHSTTIDATGALIAGSAHTNGTRNVLKGGTVDFTFNAGTCSNISCHSGGGIITTVGDAKWGDTLNCQGCHTTLSGAHTKHVTDANYGCVDCHSGSVVDNSTILGGGAHMNSAVSVAGAKLTWSSSTPDTCATSCHYNNASVNWKTPATGACGTCHSIEGLSQGAHQAHLSTTWAVGSYLGAATGSCVTCHTTYSGEATHVDGTPAYASGAGSACYKCHSGTVPTWATATHSLACLDCHGATQAELPSGVKAPAKTNFAGSGHAATTCIGCHDNTAAHINGTLGDDRLKAALGTGNAACIYCHNDPAKVTVAAKQITQVHDGAANTCAACHDPHGTGNSIMVNTTLNGTAVSFTGSNFVNGSGTGVCQACHTGTAYYKQNVAETEHFDSSTNCLECHSHKGFDGTKAFEPSRACDACHGYPPAPRTTLYAVTFGTQGNWSSARFEDYSGGGGAHVVEAHLAKSIKPSDGWAPCLACHKGGADAHAKAMPMRSKVQNVTVQIDPQFRFSDEAFIVYTSAVGVNGKTAAIGANKSGSCFNVSCHISTSPKWSTER